MANTCHQHQVAGLVERVARQVAAAPARNNQFSQSPFNRPAAWQLGLASGLQRNYTVVMNALRFEWDPLKAAANAKKHGVSFDEARTVFFDERAKLIDDPDHSGSEDRFVLLGISGNLRLILACHCYRDDDQVIRIISARKATPQESRQYTQR